MPLVNVKLVEGVFSGEQKQQIVRSLTEAMVAIEGENMRGPAHARPCPPDTRGPDGAA